MALGFFDILLNTPLILVILFIVFIFFVKRLIKIVLNAVWIGIASLIFPIFLNNFLGYTFPLTIQTFIMFLTLGLGLYASYLLVHAIYFILGIIERILGIFTLPFKKSKKSRMEEIIDKRMEKKEKEKKKNKKNKKKDKKEKKGSLGWQKQLMGESED